nr:peptidyl-prolyl cis-trans isomerase [Eubacterium sp.]
MNSSKKLAKNDGIGQGTQDTKKSVPSIISSKNKVLALIGIITVVVLCAGVCYMQLRPRAIVKVIGSDANNVAVTNTVYMKEAVYDILQTETQYNMYSSIYQQMYGTTYWDMENVDEAGRTGAGAAKKQVMDGIKQREIMCMEAEKLGYKLTDEEKKAAAEEVKKAMENMTDAQKKLPGLDQETLTTVFEKNALAEKFRQVLLAQSGIDREAVKASVNKDDYKQYTLQYYMVSNKNGTDENAADVTEETKQKNLENMTALKEKAKTTDDFSTLLEEKDTTGIVAMQTLKLVKNEMEESTFLTKKLRNKLIKMENGEISDVIEGEDGYYLVRMENNDDSEAYDAQCETVVQEEESKKFSEQYATFAPAYTTEVQSYWKGRVTLGSYTAVE